MSGKHLTGVAIGLGAYLLLWFLFPEWPIIVRAGLLVGLALLWWIVVKIVGSDNG